MSPMSPDERLLDHEARIAVLERKSDRRTAFISLATSVVTAIATVLAALLMAGCQVPRAVQHPTPEELREARKAVVMVENVRGWSNIGRGTGFFVRPDLVATAGHVCTPDGVLTITTANGTAVLAMPILDHDGDPDDVCLLRPVGYESKDVLGLAPGSPLFGDEVVALGYHHGAVLIPARGSIGEVAPNSSLFMPIPHATEYETSSTDSPGGSSGGPVLNEDGEVVGLVSMWNSPVNLLVPVGVLREDLKYVP